MIRFAAALLTLAATPALAAPAAAPPAPAAIIALPLNPVVPASQRACATTLPGGLGYTVLRAGTGASPATTDYVLINYIGYLAANGSTFDQNMSTPMTVDGVIPGFGQGLTRMSKGAIHRICIPAALGYGATASGPIPANSALVFQVELLDFRSKAEVDAARAAQAELQARDGGVTAPGARPAPKP